MTAIADQMTQLPLCSVICLTYNHASYSHAALASVAGQTYPNIEIIVVDDGSTDGNAEVVETALKNCGRPYKLLRQDNTGNVALNMNRGIAAATGEFISMFSLDDILLPECIASKMDMLIADQQLTFIANTCNMEIDGAGNVTEPLFKSDLYESDISTADELLEHEFEKIGTFYMQGAVFSASTINEVGGYDEDLKGDDLIIRTKIFRHMQEHPEMGFRLLHTPAVQYRKHGQNIHRNHWRQVALVLEWRDRYFPDRAMPELWNQWVRHSINTSIAENNLGAVEAATASSPEIMKVYKAHCSSWRYRRRALKRRIRAFFSKR